MNVKRILMYLLEWIIPSSTAVYIVASTQFTYGTYYFWGYPLNLPAYFIACMAGAIIYYPVNKYIFKNKCEPICITVNGEIVEVKKGKEYYTDGFNYDKFTEIKDNHE